MSDKPPVLRAPNVYVTGHVKERGDSSIILPSKPLHWSLRDDGHLAGANVFVTNEAPIDFSHGKDIALSEKIISSGTLGLVHPDGAICRYLDVAPGNTEHLHETPSIDFVVCVQGRMQLKLDSGDTRIMEAGDIVVQRGTMHAWKNASETEWCRLVAVMMPAKERMAGDDGRD